MIPMSLKVFDEYLSIGGNRQTAASAWSHKSGALAFGADQNVAIWYPGNANSVGVRKILNGHEDLVTAITFLNNEAASSQEQFVSGSADGELVLWSKNAEDWQVMSKSKAHEGAVTVIACLKKSGMFVTGAATAELKVWDARRDRITPITTIAPVPRLIPLALAVGAMPSVPPERGFFAVVGGTRNEIQIYTLSDLDTKPVIQLQASLKGHEGWIRSLALKESDDEGLILASASADKYVRLWRFSRKNELSGPKIPQSTVNIEYQHTLKAKTQIISIDQSSYHITFEALLLGHEDWVYAAAWSPRTEIHQLLTASADGTLAIWEPDLASGIWISASKLGEISGQKGATTATGSAGGFWTALWSPDGNMVTCLGRTGSWRLWSHNADTSFWDQVYGVSGHTSSVNGLEWSPFGQYLLSTSSDQTTRLHAEWRRDQRRSWHEFSRPQIHGYDLNCITMNSNHQFVSGADEKLLRVFNEPKDIAGMLESLCDIQRPTDEDLPDMAAIPVLGLSNKSIGEEDDSFTEISGKKNQEYAVSSTLDTSLPYLREPPNEDILARHTLWPEHEKLYGHGYEISECAASDGYLATVCKASSTEHAVIRIYNTASWAEIKPALQAHSLTVTRLAWSLSPEDYLLSVGRDRQWAVFGLGGNDKFQKLQSNPKAHSRMILDAAWSPVGGRSFFATAGRDKTIKIWCNKNNPSSDDDDPPNFIEREVIKRETAITAVSFTCNADEDYAILAAGEENGKLSLHFFQIAPDIPLVTSIEVPLSKCPTKAINRLAWRDNSFQYNADGVGSQLAIAAADGSVRILGFNIEDLCASMR